MSVKSITQPVFESTAPERWSSSLNECPWSRPHLCPAGTFGSRWAASTMNSLKISKVRIPSAKSKRLMSLQAQAPSGVGETEVDGRGGVGLDVGTIARLKTEVLKLEVLEVGGGK